MWRERRVDKQRNIGASSVSNKEEISMASYTISAVSPRVDEYSTKYGPMKGYKVKFQQTGETVVTVNQKAATKPPMAGETLDGSIDMNDAHGPKFKKEFNQGGFGDSKPSTPGQTSTPRDDMAIRAQFAIKAAVELHKGKEWDLGDIYTTAKDLFDMIDKVKDSNKQPVLDRSQVDEVFPVNEEEQINLDDIPF
jgi:hypothetical protein